MYFWISPIFGANFGDIQFIQLQIWEIDKILDLQKKFAQEIGDHQHFGIKDLMPILTFSGFGHFLAFSGSGIGNFWAFWIRIWLFLGILLLESKLVLYASCQCK